ncbi:hypothetical protein KSP40_PGU006109 [Platanthera guangdongensis]|uniref:Uncharacterized protein n=1 Tax=Platanthera guangdongensis TaxID=2320717 RepID=A0ABR2M706_9ASPA
MSPAISSVAILVVVATIGAALWRARDDPQSLCFALTSYIELGLLFLCIRSVERLPEEGGAAAEKKRRRQKLAVWSLATALCVTFCFRVQKLLPPALAAAAWAMALAVSSGGFYLFFVCNQ